MESPTIVGIDVDGVCADLETPWIARLNRAYGLTKTPADITTWDFWKPWGLTDDQVWAVYHPEIYLEVTPYAGARHAVGELRLRGHTIRFVSSCGKTPEAELRFARAKRQWLVQAGFTTLEAVADEFVPLWDKTLAAVNLLVDDHVHHVTRFPRAAVLVDRPHNRQTTGVHRIPNLAALPGWLTEHSWLAR